MNKEKIEKKKICYKCKKKPEYFFRNELFTCFNCFWEVMNKKFRSFLKSKMQIQGKNLKVFSFFDGSLNSLILNSLFEEKAKHIQDPKNPLHKFVYFGILFVDFFEFEKLIAKSEEDL